MNDYPTKKCIKCDKFNHEKQRMRNKLRCMFMCDEYEKVQSRKIYEYNRAVSGDDFDTQELFEHGKKVFGSGWKGQENAE